jgi:hypothetical protein
MSEIYSYSQPGSDVLHTPEEAYEVEVNAELIGNWPTTVDVPFNYLRAQRKLFLALFKRLTPNQQRQLLIEAGWQSNL